MKGFFTKIFGSRNDRLLSDYSKIVTQINALESEMQSLSDDALQLKTEEFKSEYLDSPNLDELLRNNCFLQFLRVNHFHLLATFEIFHSDRD